MKKYLLYELKKNTWALIVFSAVCIVPYVATLSTMSLYSSWTKLPADSRLFIVFLELTVLAFIAPVLCFSFKMQKRGVDLHYALPIKREKLYAVKTIVGLLIVLTPYTLAYFCGFFTLLLREGNPFRMQWYLPAYFSGALCGVCLFGVNAFAFTCANKKTDGVLFMLVYAVVGSLAAAYMELVIHTSFRAGVIENFSTVLPLFSLENEFTRLIRGYSADFSLWAFLCPCVTGAAAYGLLFALLRFEKGENAERISDSWFGYKLLIPLVSALVLGMSELSLLNVALTAVGAIVATLIYRRKFKFAWRYWLMIGGAILLGVLLNQLVIWTQPPAVNSPTEAFLRGLLR